MENKNIIVTFAKRGAQEWCSVTIPSNDAVDTCVTQVNITRAQAQALARCITVKWGSGL